LEARKVAFTKEVGALAFDFRSKIVSKPKQKKTISGEVVVEEPPVPHLSKLNQHGYVLLTFSEEIQMVPNLTLINNGTIVKDGKTYPVLEVVVEPGEDSDLENLEFVWNATDQTNTTLTLKLYFV